MRLTVLARWVAFAIYTTIFLGVPFLLLFGNRGLPLSVFFSVGFLTLLRFRGREKTARALGTKPLYAAEAPALHQVVHELCRRLQIPAPRIEVLESPALNLGVFGFNRRHTSLIVTRGALNTFSRGQMMALVARTLSPVWFGDTICETWLSRFLAVFEKGGVLGFRPPVNEGHPTYAIQDLLINLFFFPLTLFPNRVLRPRRSVQWLDNQAVKLSRLPRELSEGLRLLEASSHRVQLLPPLSTRHLFLVAPAIDHPLARLFFRAGDLSDRIRNLEALQHVVGQS